MSKQKFWLVCRRCGISSLTLRKWWKRYLEFGTEELLRQSKRPHTSLNSKVTNNIKELDAYKVSDFDLMRFFYL